MAKRARPSGSKPDLQTIVSALLADHSDPAQLLELFYWSEEPNLLPTIRALVGMTEETRAALCAYLTVARDPAGIVAHVSGEGALVLATADVASVARGGATRAKERSLN